MTTEQKLSAVIEAQVRAGFKRFEFGHDEITLDSHPSPRGFWCKNEDGEGQFEPSIIGFLLDPKGLKAAYGKVLVLSLPKNEFFGVSEDVKAERWEQAADEILRAWLSGGAEAAISTAYDLLPK